MDCLTSCFPFLSRGSAVSNVPLCRLDSKKKSSSCITSNFSVKGQGGVLGDSVLEQDKVYFEVHLIEAGTFGFGVARRNANLNEPFGTEPNSWLVQVNDGKKGNIYSCLFDQSSGPPTVTFWCNGEPFNTTYENLKGPICPALYVEGNSMLEVNFGQIPFRHKPPQGYSAPIPAVSIL